ncbi:MAG: polysulfide reductase NrfD [Dehalococcoidales bacterium]|nr:polysulfide reductase NrfD [Dehalococcoidales bacterium]
MDLSYSPVEGKSRSYKLLVAVLAALALLGLVSFGVSYIQGHQVFGANNAVPWGMPIILFVYFIGLSAGSLILSSLTYVFGREEYKPIARLAVFTAVLLIFGAMLFIFVDLGRPEKFWRLFMFFYLNNMTSMFAINGILYGGYFILSLIYFGFIVANKPKYTRIIGTIAVIWAVMVHTGTGTIWGVVGTREIYSSPIKPFEFLAAAITSGTGLLILVVTATLYFTKRSIDKKLLLSLARLLAIVIIVLLVMVFFDKLIHAYFPAREGIMFLFTGPYWWLFWCLQIGMGIVIPLLILFHPRAGKSVKGVLIASASVVIGVLGERTALVIPGTAQVQQLYPGTIEGIWGAVGTFSITFWETALSVGIIALAALLFVLGLKYLEILPAGESSKAAKQE